MFITSVKKEKQHQVRLILENGAETLIDIDTAKNHCLKAGCEITEEKLAEIEYESQYERAKSRALWYLDRADHTEKALYNKLLRAGFDKKASAAVIARLSELDVINDERFAENFAERCASANVSKREALTKMLGKGVPYDTAKAALDGTETDEEAQIAAVIAKKYVNKLSQENGTQKVYAALIRKGFSFSAVKNALKKYSEELEFSEE